MVSEYCVPSSRAFANLIFQVKKRSIAFTDPSLCVDSLSNPSPAAVC